MEKPVNKQVQSIFFGLLWLFCIPVMYYYCDNISSFFVYVFKLYEKAVKVLISGDP